MLVRIVPWSGSSRCVPSLSSASTTNHSLPVHWAPVPMSLTSPPMTKPGRSPASARISMSIEVVVVLPWVPATASDFACGTDRCQHSGPAQHGDVELARLVELVEVRRDRRRCRHCIAADDVRPRVADVDVDPGGPESVEHLALAQVDARHVVAHLGERDGDRAHAGTRPLRRRGDGAATTDRAVRRGWRQRCSQHISG